MDAKAPKVTKYNVCGQCPQTLYFVTITYRSDYDDVRCSNATAAQARRTPPSAHDLDVERLIPPGTPDSADPDRSYPQLEVAWHVTHKRYLLSPAFTPRCIADREPAPAPQYRQRS